MKLRREGHSSGSTAGRVNAAGSVIPQLARVEAWGCLVAFGVLIWGCRLDMHQQPKYKPYDPSSFFNDGRSERPTVPGSVARVHLETDEHLHKGKIDGVLVDAFPFAITRRDLERGRERFNIFCTPCHDYTGSGRGMIVLRGFQQPPSYHIDRLRKAPVGHFFDVITNGFGAMHSYGSRVPVEDRWRIVAYIRALQLSQGATLAEVPEVERQQLQGQAK
jgi:hypothetical protein